MKTFILPYNMTSKSAKALAQALHVKRLRPTSPALRGRGRQIISWGNHNIFPTPHHYWLNSGMPLKIAANKLWSFRVWGEQGVPLPEWTESAEEAASWGSKVVVRHDLYGHSGAGIEIVEGVPPAAPLYTKYISKRHEYRVHVFQGRIIDFQKKRRRSGVEASDTIRNHAHNWVYCREDVELPLEVGDAAIKAINAIGLDFGAVDIMYHSGERRPYVLEVNTAPGLFGTTLERYAEAFSEVMYA